VPVDGRASLDVLPLEGAGRSPGPGDAQAARATAPTDAQPALGAGRATDLAFALGHPGLGPRRIAVRLARPEWGGLVISANGVYKALVRHGLNTRAKRLALIAGYRATAEPPREPPAEPHIDTTRPGELVGIDCFFVGRLHGAKG